MLLLTRLSCRFYMTRPGNQPINHLAIIGGGAGLSYLLSALRNTYRSLNQSLKICIFEPHYLGTGHAFHPESPAEFITNTPSSDIDGFDKWWATHSKENIKIYPGDEKVPRNLVGRYLLDQLNHILDDPNPLQITHIPKKVIDFYAPNRGGAQSITHLVTDDGARYSAQAYVIASGQLGPHKELPGVPPASVVNSIYPFINHDSPLTRALDPLLLNSKTKLRLMIIGSGPSGIEAAYYLLNHYETRIHLTIVGHIENIPREIALHIDVSVLERNAFEAISDDKKYADIGLVINSTGINPDTRGGLFESIMPLPQSTITLLRGYNSMKTNGFHPVVQENIAGQLLVDNAYIYGSAVDGNHSRLSNFPGMARQLAQEIGKGIQPRPVFKTAALNDFSLLPLDRYITGYQEGSYYLEPLKGDKNEQQYEMIKGFTANSLLRALLLPYQVPPAICAKNDDNDQLYLLHKRVDKNFLSTNVKELLGLTDPKLKIEGLRHLFTISPEGKTVISLSNGHVIPVIQRIRTKVNWFLLAGDHPLEERLLHMVLFPYHLIENKLPPSLIEHDNPPHHVAIPSFLGTIGHNLLPEEKSYESFNELAFARAFRNKEDPSPLAMPLVLVHGLTRKQSERRMLARMSAYQDMTSYEFITRSIDLFDFFIKEVNSNYKNSAQKVGLDFYDRMDISLRILSILKLREWIFATGTNTVMEYINRYHQLCLKHGIYTISKNDLFLQSPLQPDVSLTNPYLDRTIQILAFEIFKSFEGLRDCEPHRLRALRMDINELSENDGNKPLYVLSDVLYEDFKRNQNIKEAKNKIAAHEFEIIPRSNRHACASISS